MDLNLNERRQHQRVPAQVLIKYQNADQFFTDYVQNISRGGIFVPTQQPLPEETYLQVSFSLPDYDRLITTEGIVVHSIQPGFSDTDEPAGMGIQFHALSEENQQLIDSYVESMLQ